MVGATETKALSPNVLRLVLGQTVVYVWDSGGGVLVAW